MAKVEGSSPFIRFPLAPRSLTGDARGLRSGTKLDSLSDAWLRLPPIWGWFALQWLRKNRYL
jgi:hypothetical protein